MLKNTLQFIRHNLRTGKSIMILLSVVMIICGPVPSFLIFSDNLRRYYNNKSFMKTSAIINELTGLFDIPYNGYYHVLFSLIAAVSGLVLAFILFFYFRKKDSSDFFLSLPLTRTEAYIANYASGTLYYLIPLVISSLVTVIGLVVMGALEFVSISDLLLSHEDTTGLLAFLGTNIVFFFLFFSLGTIASLLSSNGINSLVVYGTINLYPIAFIVLLLSAANIFNNDILDFSESIINACLYITPVIRQFVFSELHATAWTYILIPLFTAAFAVLGCYICNKRPAETWSSAIIFIPVRLTLQYMYCFIAAFASGLFFYYITERSVFNIILGAVIGLVLSFMILNIIFERDVKAIFKKPLRLVWSAVIFIAVFLVIVMDAFGIFRYRQPAFSSVEYVNVNLSQSVVNSYYSSNLEKDYGTSKIDEPEAKEAAIKLYTLFHEEIRNNNYNYYRGRNTTDHNTFEGMLRSYTSGFNTSVKMIRSGKEIRPLREAYFEKDEEYYDLFKAIYDCEQYTDSMIPLLSNSEINAAQVTTTLLRSYGGGERFTLKGLQVNERLHAALLADYKEASFDDLQTLSPYVITVYYTMLTEEYKNNNARERETSDYYGDTKIQYEESFSITIPECFTRTIAVIEENESIIKTIDYLHEMVYNKISRIIVRKFTSDSAFSSDTTTVTDKAEIARILNDMYYSMNRTPTFPKYGVSLEVYIKPDELSEDDKYYEYYKDAEYAEYSSSAKRVAPNTEFLQRFSTLY